MPLSEAGPLALLVPLALQLQLVLPYRPVVTRLQAPLARPAPTSRLGEGSCGSWERKAGRRVATAVRRTHKAAATAATKATAL